MPFASSLIGALLPLLLMLSPFAVMAARDCPERTMSDTDCDDERGRGARRPPLIM